MGRSKALQILLLVRFWSKARAGESCVFYVSGYPEHLGAGAQINGGFYESNETIRGKSIYVNMDHPLFVAQWGQNKWDFCLRDVPYGPASCWNAWPPRVGEVSDIFSDGPVTTWGHSGPYDKQLQSPCPTTTTTVTSTGTSSSTTTTSATTSTTSTSTETTSTTSATSSSTSSTSSTVSSTSSSSSTTTSTATSTTSSSLTSTSSSTSTISSTRSSTTTITSTSSSSSTTDTTTSTTSTSTITSTSSSSSTTGTTTSTTSTHTTSTSTSSTSTSSLTTSSSSSSSSTQTSTSSSASSTTTKSSTSTSATTTSFSSTTTRSTTSTTISTTATSATTSATRTRTSTASSSSTTTASSSTRTTTATGTTSSATTTRSATRSSSSGTAPLLVTESSSSSSTTSRPASSWIAATSTAPVATTSTTGSTITTTTGTAPAASPGELLEWVGPQERSLVQEVLNSTGSEPIVVKTSGAVLTAFQVNSSSAATTVEVKGTEAKVTVPSSVLQHVAVEKAVFVVSVVDAPVLGHIEDKGAPTVDASGLQVQVQGLVSANLFAGGSRIALKELQEPILLVLPVNQTGAAECAYWDELAERWATDGLETLQPSAGGLVTCATTHLTMFAAIFRGLLQTLQCTNLHLLSEEGISALWSTEWYTEPIAICYWLFIMTLFATFAAASVVDGRRAKGTNWDSSRRTWSDESFLIPWTADDELNPYWSSHVSRNSNISAISATSSLGTRDSAAEALPDGRASKQSLASMGSFWSGRRNRPSSRRSVESMEGCAEESETQSRDLEAPGALPRPRAPPQKCDDGRESQSTMTASRASFWSNMSPKRLYASFASEESARGERMYGSEQRSSQGSRATAPKPSVMERVSQVLVPPRDSHEAVGQAAPLAFQVARSYTRWTAAGCSACLMFLKKSEAVKEACGDVFSRCFDGCKEVKDFLASICQPFQGEVDGGGVEFEFGIAASMSKKLLNGLLVSYARKQAAASLGLSVELVTFLTEDQTLQALLVKAARLKDSEDPAFQQSMKVWLDLHAEVMRAIQQCFYRASNWQDLPKIFPKLFIWANPFVSFFTHCNIWSCRLRVLFFSMEIMGALTVGTIFFQISGMAGAKQQPPGCEVELEGIYEQLGRLVAIGVVAVLAAHIPLSLLFALHSRRIVRVDGVGCPEYCRWLQIWKLQDTVLWVLGLCYLVFTAFFIAVFLANVTHEDVLEWGTSSLSAVLEDVLMMPLSVGLTVPMAAMAVLSFASWWQGVSRDQILDNHLEQKTSSRSTWFAVSRSI